MLPTTQKPKQGMPPWVWIVAAVIYAAWPVDLVVDVLPIVGWADDVAVAFLCIKQWHAARRADKTPPTEKSSEHGPKKG